MDDFIYVLKRSPLFYGIREEEIPTMLQCLVADRQQFQTGELICRMGQAATDFAMILTGRGQVIRQDFWGGEERFEILEPGSLFGPEFACAQATILPVGLVALEDCEVVFMEYKRMINVCSLACGFHNRLLQNMLRILADQNIHMERNIRHMAKKTTREKLLSYLSEEGVKNGSPSFEIPLSRQELADYLSVDRSAMSSELGKLQKEGWLEAKRNRFVLKTSVISPSLPHTEK